MNDVWTAQRRQELQRYLQGDYSAFRPKPRFREIAIEQKQDILNAIAETMGMSFSDTLLHMIDARGMSDVETYKKARVDRRVFSRIRSSSSYQPSRKTAIRLCLALRCSTMEAITLLEKAGLCLSHSQKDDLVLLYCFDHDIYDLDAINGMLLELGLEGIL